ncbi:MAG: GTPase Era [Gemmatimonadota bacterium]|nr:GTPase Era [Gemmatimonadota bacterium]
MSTPTAAGFVAIVGLPNTGKSTLLNGLVGERLSIVTPKAQTTRQRLLGIFTDDRHQAVFVDTPGLLEPRYLLQQGMLEDARQAAAEADVVLYVADAGDAASLSHARAWSAPRHRPLLLCLNKVDRPGTRAAEGLAAGFRSAGPWDEVRCTVATRGTGVADLRAAILSRLPAGPFLYPEDEIATAPVRFFAAELVREACFQRLGQELPYSIAVGIEEFREAADPVYVAATIFVERESQKGMVIGRAGAMVREIGTEARRGIERLTGRRVYLDLRVKVMRNWRRDPARLKLLGYPIPSRRD